MDSTLTGPGRDGDTPPLDSQTTDAQVPGIQAPDAEDLDARRRRLAALLRARASASGGASGGDGVASAGRDLPLSVGQERLYRLARLAPDVPLYNVAVAHRLRGPLQPAALARAVQRIAERHDILRTRFPLVDGAPVQRIADHPPGELLVARAITADDIDAAVAAEAAQVFDLEAGPLWRIGLFRLGPEDHVLTLVMHHIVTDGWSFVLLLNDLGTLTAAFGRGAEDPLPAPPQYAAHAERQRADLARPDMAAQHAHWRAHLDGRIPALILPEDPPAPPAEGPAEAGPGRAAEGRAAEGCTGEGPADGRAAASLPLALPAGLGARLAGLGRQEGVSAFMLTLTAFAAALHRCSGQTDLLLCTPVSGRHRARTRDVVGYCNNILPIRLDLSGTPTLRDLLAQVRRVTLDAHRNQDVPFETIAEAPALRRIPLSRVLFSVDMPWPPTLAVEGLEVTPLPVETGSADFDLSVSLWPVGEGLDGTLRYKTALFGPGRAAGIAQHYRTALEALASAPDTPVAALPAGPAPRSGPAAAERRAQAPRFPLEEKLAQVWREVFEQRDIGLQQDFRSLGASSLAVAMLGERLQARLGLEITLPDLFRAGSIARLTALLEARGDALARDPLAPIRPEGSRPPLFLVEGVSIYYPLAECLAPDRPVYGLISPSVSGTDRVEDIAAGYVEAILRVQPSGPVHLGGLSFGGLLAFEAAQQLRGRGAEVGVLALFDTPGPDAYTPHRGMARLLGHARNAARFGRPYLQARLRGLRRRVLRPSSAPAAPALDAAAQRRAFNRSAGHYRHRPYDGQIALFKLAQRGAMSDSLFDPALGHVDPLLGWGTLAPGRVTCTEVDGDHISMLRAPNVEAVARRLDALMQPA